MNHYKYMEDTKKNSRAIGVTSRDNVLRLDEIYNWTWDGKVIQI